MADFDERITFIDEMAEAKGYSQDYVDFLKDCAEWADKYQWEQIREGLEKNVNVSIYADPQFSWTQMREILVGLAEGLDVSEYADPKYDWVEMALIRRDLEAAKYYLEAAKYKG